MRIVITGGRGQVGVALQETLAGNEIVIADLPETDITDFDSINHLIQEARADLVIHCAAYTDVDGCSRDPELAMRVNGYGTRNVALASENIGAELLHISTNEVFAGNRPNGYEEWMPLEPVNAYGRSKAAAENFVTELSSRHYIVRISWLFAPGGRNFIHAILNKAKTAGAIRVVTDEIANPTYSLDLAKAIKQLTATHKYGIYHLTNAGACSRWEFANEILQTAGLHDVANIPILLRDYQRDSSPPPNAALLNINAASLGIELRPWQEALLAYMEEYHAA